MAVLGFGGLFFRSKDPQALTAWYRHTLGIGAGLGTGPVSDMTAASGMAAASDTAPPTPNPSDAPYWWAGAGPVVFQPFAANSDYFAADRSYMLNFRVDDLDAMLADFDRKGIAYQTNPAWDDPAYGRFARLHDPDSNPIELWQPPSQA